MSSTQQPMKALIQMLLCLRGSCRRNKKADREATAPRIKEDVST